MDVMATQQGMGAVIFDGGCTFRLWAPHAESVTVLTKKPADKDFQPTPMAKESDSNWSVNVPAVVPGDHYLFEVTKGDFKARRRDPYARQVTNSAGVCVVTDPHSFDWQGVEFELPPHNELVIYEMHIGSFVDADGKPATLQDAIHYFDHLKKLGINAIQIMPVAEFAGDRSWGYNPADIFAVESSYGGPDGLKTFVREAHRNGIAVILDVVYNHFGPSDLDLWQFDGWSENEGGGIYFYNDHRAETPWGKTRPDYGRGEVRQFIRDNAMMWLNDYRMDGLRFDMTLYVRTIGGNCGDDIPEGWSLMQWINKEIRTLDKRRITIAEDLRKVDAVTADPDLGGAGFNTQWDASFVHPVRETVVTPDDAHRSMDVVRDAMLFKYDNDAFRRVVYSESHDEVANGKARVPYEIDPEDPLGWFAQKRSTLAAALVFTAPGIPMIFQGQEFLQGGWFRDDVPLDWNLNEEFGGIVRLYRDLIFLRLNRHGHSKGLTGQNIAATHVNDDMNVIVFQRWDQHGTGDDVVIAMNFTNSARDTYKIGMPSKGLWKLRINSDAKIYSKDFGNAEIHDVEAVAEGYDGLPASATLNLPPYSFLIFSQDKA